jgi:hypothetical protein
MPETDPVDVVGLGIPQGRAQILTKFLKSSKGSIGPETKVTC